MNTLLTHPEHRRNIILILLVGLLIAGWGAYAPTALGQQGTTMGGNLDTATNSGLVFGSGNTASLFTFAKTVINTFLAILGLVFIFLMLYAGFIWMTARGDQEMVTKALETIRAAIIGLAIIIASYGITKFVIDKLGATSAGSL